MDLHFTGDRSEIESTCILLNVTKYHKTNKIENMDLSCDLFKQFKVADIFEDTELYLQTEKILEERVRHVATEGICCGRPPEVFAPKLVAVGNNENRQHLDQSWRGVAMQMGKVEEDFIMEDQRTMKYLLLRKFSVFSGMNPMKIDMHETECMVSEDTFLQRHAEVGNTKLDRTIRKSLPVSNIHIQPQSSNSQYTNMVGNGTQGNRSAQADSGSRQMQGNMPTNEVNHCNETERKELQYRGVLLSSELTGTRISQKVVQIETERQSRAPTVHSSNAINKTKQKRL